MGNNSGVTVGNDNLKPWQPGQSGNPAGRPKGSRNLKSIIRDILEDNSIYDNLTAWEQRDKSKTPIEAIVIAQISKAVDGDTRAADLLFKYGFDTSAPDTEEKITGITVHFVGQDDEEDDFGNTLE